jgi:hypothetical protein
MRRIRHHFSRIAQKYKDLRTTDYLTSARFGHRMIFSKLWFLYNKTKQGDIYERQEKSLT